MPLTLRLSKGSELTYAELDQNFSFLDSRLSSQESAGYLDSIGVSLVIDSSYIQARQLYFDSATIKQFVLDFALDSIDFGSYITKSYIDGLNVDADTLDGQDGTFYLDWTNTTNKPNILDSADVSSIITNSAPLDSANVSSIILNDVDSAYVQARQSSATVLFDSAGSVVNYFAAGHAGDIIPDVDSSRSLGSPSKKWKDLYLSGQTIYIGGTTISAIGGSIITGQPIEAELKIAAGAGLDVNDNIIVNNDTTGTNLTGGFMFQSNNAQKSGFNIVNQDQLGQLTVAMDANLNGSLINWEGAIRTGNVSAAAAASLDSNLTIAMANTGDYFSPLFVGGAGVDGSWVYDTDSDVNKFKQNGSWEKFIPVSTLKSAAASADSFGSFQTLIAAL
jgi:hypothetical protein